MVWAYRLGRNIYRPQEPWNVCANVHVSTDLESSCLAARSIRLKRLLIDRG
jgi:hypothetical protein